MKKITALVLAIIILVCCTACGSAKAPADRLAQIKEKGYIEMATEPYWAPNEFIDSTKSGDEQYVGMDIEIGKAIAEKIGVELKVVPLEFSAVLSGTAEGKYDMAISALAWSEERAEAMNMSVGYNLSTDEDSGYGFLVREGDEDKWCDAEAVKAAVIVTQSGSVQEGFYNKFIGECKELKLFSSMTDCYLAVAEGKADVCITDCSSGRLYADANGGLAIPAFRFDVQEDGTRVCCPKEGTDSLMAVINEVLTELETSGQVLSWKQEYSEYAKTLGIDVNE